MSPCKKCGHKTVLATSLITYFTPDAEPYESGAHTLPETMEEGEEIYAHVMVGIHWCEKCEEISDAWIEDPQQEENNPGISATPNKSSQNAE